MSRGGAERERERAGSIPSSRSLTQGSSPWTVRSWPEPKSRVRYSTDWASQAPPSINSYNVPTRWALNHFLRSEEGTEVQKVVCHAETYTTQLGFDASFVGCLGPALSQHSAVSQPKVSPLLSTMWSWPHHYFSFRWCLKPKSDTIKIQTSIFHTWILSALDFTSLGTHKTQWR